MTLASAPAPVPTTEAPRQSLRRIGERWYGGYLFILPHFAIFLLMVGIPFVYNIWISLSDYTFGGEETFVGLQNFMNLANPDDFHFPVFWNGVWNTLIFVIVSTPMLVIAGLLLAVLVNGKYRGRNFFRAVYFAP